MPAARVDEDHYVAPLVTEQARDRAIRRFITPPDAHEIPDSTKRILTAVHDAVIELGALIDATLPDGLDKSLALRHLEDTHIRSARALYGELS